MPTGNTGLTLADLRKKKKPNRTETWIAGDSIAADRLREAKEALERAERRYNINKSEAVTQEYEAAKLKYDEVRAEIEPTLIHFVFEALPINEYDALVGMHLWTEPDKKKWRADNANITDDQMENMPAWNPETFPRALVVASCIEPKVESKQVLEDWLSDTEAWNAAEIGELFAKAMEANNSRRVVELGKG